MNVTAALAVALREAADPSFRSYGQQIVKNAKALAQALLDRGYDLVTGGTDNHMLILDLRDRPLSGKAYAKRLAKAGIITSFKWCRATRAILRSQAEFAWGRQQ